MKDKNVLITGVSGFVGSHLAKHLINCGAAVYGLIQRRADGFLPRNVLEKNLDGEIRLLEGDLVDISSLAFALEESQPDIVFHLAAQSYIPRSFSHPLETTEVNCMGTENLLEAVRIKDLDPKIVFAGTSEEYGLVISSEKQYEIAKEKYGVIFPEPEKIPELPISEKNPLRPMSPYAVSKVFGDYLMRNYHHSYGLKTIVSRGFNHEGAGRGKMFVTSTIASQVMKLKFGEIDRISIGNVNAFRDWSHISDMIKGYCLLAEKASYGEVYNQGSMRTNSILSYILLCLENASHTIEKIETVHNGKTISNPTQKDDSQLFGIKFEKTLVDKMMLEDKVEFSLSDEGIVVHTDKGKILIEFDKARFRQAEVPLLLSDTKKFRKIGFRTEHTLEDIIEDQLNYFIDKKNRM